MVSGISCQAAASWAAISASSFPIIPTWEGTYTRGSHLISIKIIVEFVALMALWRRAVLCPFAPTIS